MCLAIPYKIVSIDGNTAHVKCGEVEKDAKVDLIDAKVGDYIMMQAGIAIEKLDVKDAEKMLEEISKI